MTTQPTPAPGNSNPNDAAAAAPQPAAKTMDAIVALCRRRGFVFQSSEIYGGINGFWDYGPLGVELKRNLKDAWWHDIVRAPGKGPNGNLIEMVGVDCTIIMNPKVWVASGHAAGFNDPMVDCKACKSRFRADQLLAIELIFPQTNFHALVSGLGSQQEILDAAKKKLDKLAKANGDAFSISGVQDFTKLTEDGRKQIECPTCNEKGHLTEPRQFNLMFQTSIGAVQTEDSQAYLRPETAQGIFANFKNIVDTSRVKIPFGIAQVGKAFRNEVTPRNFTFRSREFEQMEIEFFIHPDSANEWYRYWRDSRFAWWQSIGLSSENLQLREHDRDELAHYAKEGAGTSDIEYRFPFTSPGFGELEGVAHRTDFDLKQHAEHSGLKDKLKYFDQELQVKLQGQGVAKEEIQQRSKYFPHVIEPSAGADRGTLALICEAYTPDPSRASGVYMKFHPRMAPVKAGIFPLVNKDGMSEVGENLYLKLRQKYAVEFDEKQSIGKRYARMDEAGAPYCFTIDGDTLTQQTVTVRHRDTQQQERVSLDKVEAFLAEKIG
jgi:glycyl-tRNA synthetase